MLQTNKIYNMDCIEGMKQLEDNSVDSIVTDPPYELGFMGKSWDASGIAYNTEMWKEAYRVLKPGGHLLSFGGTRTYHRMACAIEDAGFEIRDQIQWVYGSGFPKSLNIGKAIDKLNGIKPIGVKEPTGGITGGKNTGAEDKGWHSINNWFVYPKCENNWKGWGTALKPANEPICVARKPLAEKTVAENVLKYGTGGINIDDCRIGYLNEKDKKDAISIRPETSNSKGFQTYSENEHSDNFSRGIERNNLTGRFPANVIHDGSPEVLELFPNTTSEGHWAKTKVTGFGDFGNGKSEYFGVGEKDKSKGSAARFFYCAKASKSERNAGLDGFEDKQYSYDGRNKEIENPYQRNKSIAKNNHPTVKPLKLMEYLVKLVTPKGGVCLDPFMGSGTTAVACKKNGFNYLGFDMTKEYVEIAEARIKATECQKKLLEV